MNKAALINHIRSLSNTGVLPLNKMHGFHNCAADTSDVFHIGYRGSGNYTPCLLEQRNGYTYTPYDLLPNPSNRDETDVLFQLFRSYATYCAVSIVTANSDYLLVTDAPTASTRAQIAKYANDVTTSGLGYRMNLYKDSRATIAETFGYILPSAIHSDLHRSISRARSNAHVVYAIPSKWEEYFSRNNPPVFTPDLKQALDMIFRYAYGHGVNEIELDLRG